MVEVRGKHRPLDHIAFLRQAKRNAYGQGYDVIFHGETIVENSVDAEFDACRVLKARGISGRIGFKHEGRDMVGLVTPIDRGAELTVQDDEQGRPRLRKWKPYDRFKGPPPVAEEGP